MDETGYEDVKKYVPGGYHPVDIGDEIAQYTVLHKLGSGGLLPSGSSSVARMVATTR